MNTSALVLGFAALALGFSYRSDAPTACSEPLPRANFDRTCKPSGPIDVELLQLTDIAGGSMEIELRLTPVLPMQQLSWRLQLGPGMQLLKGPQNGRMAQGLAARSLKTERMRISMPSNLRAGFQQLSVEVSGVFQGSDAVNGPGPERVLVKRSLSWGEPASPGVEKSFFDPERAETVRFVEIPSSTEPGIGAVHKVGR